MKRLKKSLFILALAVLFLQPLLYSEDAQSLKEEAIQIVGLLKKSNEEKTKQLSSSQKALKSSQQQLTDLKTEYSKLSSLIEDWETKFQSLTEVSDQQAKEYKNLLSYRGLMQSYWNGLKKSYEEKISRLENEKNTAIAVTGLSGIGLAVLAFLAGHYLWK